MTDNNTKRAVILAAAVLLGGTVTYFLYKRNRRNALRIEENRSIIENIRDVSCFPRDDFMSCGDVKVYAYKIALQHNPLIDLKDVKELLSECSAQIIF